MGLAAPGAAEFAAAHGIGVQGMPMTSMKTDTSARFSGMVPCRILSF